MLTRRDFLKNSAFFGAGLLITRPRFNLKFRGAFATPTLDPTTVTKYVTPLFIPPAMPKFGQITGKLGEPIDYYEIAVRQFSQQILPTGMPATTVWGYGAPGQPASFHYPSATIEAVVNKPVRVKWINGLVDANNNFLPHLFPVDPTLHWANPPGPRDEHGMFDTTPGRYLGPIPIVTHLHGGHSGDESDGFPEAWYLPNASNIPAGYYSTGSFHDPFKVKAEALYGQAWDPGSAVFQYLNDQPATTLWYHDHTMGITRLNVYAGPAGFYILRGGANDTPANVLPDGGEEIPIAIQDRSFNTDGSLFYPDSREAFDGFTGPYVPDSDIPPIWNPETFSNAMVVNGSTWPYQNVEPKRYRLRLLNGCNTRFLILKLVTDPIATRPVAPALPFWQVGAEGGFLKAPAQLSSLLMAPAERADVVVDFTGLPAGTAVYLINEGPDEPFGGGQPVTDFAPANPSTTGQVLKFVVVPLTGADSSTDPAALTLPAAASYGQAAHTRQISVNELDSAVLTGVGPLVGLLGGVGTDGLGAPMEFADQITETPIVGDTEVWEIHNFTEDAHPIHPHLIQFEVVNREDKTTGLVTPPEAWETGHKDVVVSYPGTITRIKAPFDKAGLYIWHCHILEHEDNEMMRPYQVVQPVQAGSSTIHLPLVMH